MSLLDRVDWDARLALRDEGFIRGVERLVSGATCTHENQPKLYEWPRGRCYWCGVEVSGEGGERGE